jgi:hypothetical protein
MPTVICVRCGVARDRGAVPGHCDVCAPLPEQAREAAQRLAEEATSAAAIREPRRRPRPGARRDQRSRQRPKPPRRDDVRWLVGPDPRTVAHLFGQGTPDSCCGKVAHSHRMRIAPPGKRGCRRCAYAAGFTADAAEGATT